LTTTAKYVKGDKLLAWRPTTHTRLDMGTYPFDDKQFKIKRRKHQCRVILG
jgi:hypothetical protein